MAQILILGTTDKFCFEVQALAQSQGVRCKFTYVTTTAEEWLTIGGFAALVAEAKIGIDVQKRLASLLWDKDTTAPFILFGETNKDAREAESRLFGAEIIVGRDAKTRLESFLAELATQARPGAAQVLNVAVVEDLDSPRDIICTYLEGVDKVKTFGFSGVDEVLVALKKSPSDFDCVLTDLRMPNKNGADLIREIRAYPPLQRMPVIVLTAYGSPDMLLECLAAGATGFLVKPPKKQHLKDELLRVRRILRFKLDPRLVYPNDVEKMQQLLALRGL